MRRGRGARITALASVAAVVIGGVAAASPPAARTAAPASLDWTQYLHDPQHSSMSAATAFTTVNAASSTVAWHWTPPVIAGAPSPRLEASPTVAAGRVFIGAESGGFYALDAATGAVDWSALLDTEVQKTCPARGITSTAAVANDPVSGASTVYVSGARDLYALDAATGAQLWATRIGPASTANPNAYYNWSSPAVVAGHVYVGLASSCDKPLIRGGVVELDQHTGAVLRTWHTVPAGSIGGSIWSSVAASANGRNVWVSTGNECDPTVNTCPAGNQTGDALSIVHLSGSLGVRQVWQDLGLAGSGHDWDFGSSPTLFGTAGTPPDVGACNKNGTYYALAGNPLSTAPIWADPIGAPAGSSGSCIASAVWDRPAGRLFVAGDGTTIGGTAYGGSVREIDPSTGAYVWQTGLPCAVMGTPSLDGAGVIAVATYNCPSGSVPGAYLLDASTGAVLTALPTGTSRIFGQPVFAQSNLFVATETGGLYSFAP